MKDNKKIDKPAESDTSANNNDTDGKGNASQTNDKETLVKKFMNFLFDDGQDDAAATGNADESGSDTSADDEEGNNKGSQGDVKSDKSGSADEKQKSEKKKTDDENNNADTEDDEFDAEEDELPGEDGEKKFTQSELNFHVKKRLAKQKSGYDAKISEKESEIESLKSELSQYRKLESSVVKAEFDSLPEALRDTFPGDISTPEGISQAKKWIPAAKKLASSLNLSDDSSDSEESNSKAPAGNGANPKKKGGMSGEESGGDDEKSVLDKVKSHSIYKSF